MKQGPEAIVYAGQPFKQQPICEVLDKMGNPINVHDYEVHVTIRNDRGQGCLCDLSGGNECVNALTSPTVQHCPAGVRFKLYDARQW